MSTKATTKGRKATGPADDIEALYLELLRWFYDKGDRQRARKIAPRLEAALAKQPEAAASIRGAEIRSLLAELRGDFPEAVRCRESEIRKILGLHSMAVNTPGWDYVLRQYDHSDVGDRLDLLAMLYADQGDLERAVETLQESKRFCESHQVPFDGQDLLDEFQEARRGKSDGARAPSTSGAKLRPRSRLGLEKGVSQQ
jgi:hypothetical protein